MPVNDPGPFTTTISFTSFGSKLFSFKISSINFVVYIECSLGLVFLILDKSFPSFTKAIDTSDNDVSMNKLIIL